KDHKGGDMGGRLRRRRPRAAVAVRATGCAAACFAVVLWWAAGPGSAQASGSSRFTSSSVTSSRVTSTRVTSTRVTSTRVTINGLRRGPVFDGLGAADGGGAMGRLLIDY